MFPSLALVLVFTTAFVITGLYSLIRFSALVSSAAPGGDRMAELSHLLMSIAMIGMAWGWTGGPDTPGGVVQLAVFGLLSAWFLARVLRPDGHRRIGSVYHLLAMVAMVWMVAAMPGLMGMSAGSASASGAHEHGGHGAMGGMAGASGMAAPSPAPPWMQVVTLTFVVLLGAAAVTWAARAVRPAQVPVLAAPSGQAAPQVEGEPRLRGPRLDASCHVLMSLGMAGMLLAML